jgi:hypothetical protein
MNDLDLEQDDALARRIRETLAAVADATPTEHVPVPELSDRRPRLLFAVAAAVLAVLVAAAVLVSGRDADTTVANPIPDGPMRPLPQDFDPATAAPVFTAEGEPDAVALQYLENRFPDFPAPGVTMAVTERSDTVAKARWRSGDDSGTVAEGDILMRRDSERWVVVAATTDGVDVGSVSFDGTTVTGLVSSTSEDSLFADVLDWMGQPVRNAPRPRGAGLADPQLGTAGGPAIGSLSLDIRHPGAPAIVRIRLVGGTVLGITEFRLDPAPYAPHRDYDACIAEHTTREKEPTPDIVSRNCAMALEGEVFATGSAIDRQWQLVASDEPSGQWITLRFRDQVGMFRQRIGGEGSPLRLYPIERAEACCASATATVVVVVVPEEIARVRLNASSGATVEEEAFAHLGRRYAVIVVEPQVEGEEATIEAQTPNGDWVAGDSISLAVLGG